VHRIMLFIAVSSAASAVDPPAGITIHTYNLAGVRPAVVAMGEREAGRVFERAGILVRWIDCPALDRSLAGDQVCKQPFDPLRLTVILGTEHGDAPITDTALGFALPFSGRRDHAAVLFPRIEQVAAANPDLMNCSDLLGAVLAHEIAHLLFGSMRHGPGIMLADWTRPQFKLIGQRSLLFTTEQARNLEVAVKLRAERLR
jgi:hypothetical protein